MNNSIVQKKSNACCFWFTGLPGAGKSTLANQFYEKLQDRNVAAVVLDGDHLRLGLNRDLGFSREDRRENIRRVAEVALLMMDAGLVVLVSAISPYETDREMARARFPAGTFNEVYVATDIATCIGRDPKGLYKRAKAGDITHLTGWDDPYEPPASPEFVIHTLNVSVEEAIAPLGKSVFDSVR